MPAKKPASASTTRKRKPPRKKQAAGSKGLTVAEMADVPDAATRLAEAVRGDGGEVLGMYRDPLGGHAVVVAALPIEQVEPTPFQRDRSEAHVKRLANAMERVDRFLDPIIAVRRDGALLDAERQPPAAARWRSGREVDHRARRCPRRTSRSRSSRSTPRRRTT